MVRIRPIYFVVKPVIKGFPKIVTPFLCTPTTAGKPSNVLFWPLANVTAFAGQRESLNSTKTASTAWCSKRELIAKKYWKPLFMISVSLNAN
jgi:hypothetical protein